MTCFTLGPIHIITCLPSYNITASTTLINEGETVQFTITTQNIPDGTILFYRLIGITGSITDNDFIQSNLVSQLKPITINNNTATFSVTARDDAIVEGTESFRALLITDCQNTQVANSSTITLSDAPLPAAAELFDSFILQRQYLHCAWKDNRLAVGHTAFPNPFTSQTKSGFVLESGTTNLSKIVDLNSYEFVDNPLSHQEGVTVMWTKDFLAINRNWYRQSNFFKFPITGPQSSTFLRNAVKGGRTHNGYVIDANYAIANEVNNNIQSTNTGSGAGPATVHPEEPIVLNAITGGFRWRNIVTQTTTGTISFPLGIDGQIKEPTSMQFTRDGKFLLVQTSMASNASIPDQDSNLLVYECTVTNGAATFTLRGHPQIDKVGLTGTNNYFGNNFSNSSFDNLLEIGNRLASFSYRYYSLNESGILSYNSQLTDYFHDGGAEQDIGRSVTLQNGPTVAIREDDSQIAYCLNTNDSFSGVYVFNIL